MKWQKPNFSARHVGSLTLGSEFRSESLREYLVEKVVDIPDQIPNEGPGLKAEQ